MTGCILHVRGWGDLLPSKRDEGEAHMPLTLLSSRLRHSLGRKTKANGCWKLLLLGVPHLERYHSFQWTLLFVPMCWVAILFLFYYLSLFTPVSASVLNSSYPFNDLFLQYPQFKSLHEQSSIALWTGQAICPKCSKDCHECFPSLCLSVSRVHSHFFVGRALWLVPSPVL